MWFDKNSRLRKAIKQGNLLEVTSLIENGVDINPSCYSGNRPLAVAASRGHLDILNLLIAHGAKVNFGELSETPLAQANTPVIVRTLINAGVDECSQHYVLVSTAMQTMGRGHDRLIAFLDGGVNVDARNIIQGETPLICLAHLNEKPSAEVHVTEALQSWFRGKIEILLHRGADVNAQSWNGHTALIWSAFWNTVRITEVLLKAGADPNIRNNDGMTALELAQRKGHEHVVKRLLAAGASPVLRANKPDAGDGK